MMIRNATYKDAPAIKLLLEALGYNTRVGLLVDQLERLFGTGDHQVLVYERQKEVIGFVALHFMPQLAFEGGLVSITYLSAEGQGIAEALEAYVVELARKRKCERIQVHCMDWLAPAHQFYIQQGYREYPKYFSKRLVYGE